MMYTQSEDMNSSTTKPLPLHHAIVPVNDVLVSCTSVAQSCCYVREIDYGFPQTIFYRSRYCG